MNKEILTKTVARLVSSPKGILAIDESSITCNKRFEKLGIPTTEENRREYRELLINAPEIEKYISGYILFDETIRQSTQNGYQFTSILKSKGIDIGIKVDAGLKDFPSNQLEKITEGLDGLSNRLKEYKDLGATFAKWRAAYIISDDTTPSLECMNENAKILAQYAHLCQEQDIVPIIEPEILIEGVHTIDKCYEVTAKNLDIVFNELKLMNVFLPGLILKTSMVIPGKVSMMKVSTEKIAEMTLGCLKEHVPKDIGGIVFLSGGQDDEEATLNLNAMHQKGDLPWPLTFSYSRAIQNKVLESWAHNKGDIKSAQDLLLVAARNNSEASLGQYKK